MPTIKNKTTQLLCFTSRDGDCAAIPPQQSLSITDELWADNVDQPNVQAMIDERQIYIVHDGKAPAAKVTPSATPSTAPADDAPSSGDDKSGGWASMHWQTAKKLIAAETNTATLGNLLEHEERPKFVSMLTERIAELGA